MNEFELIKKYTQSVGRKQAGTRLAVGDDAAVLAIPSNKDLVVSVDTMVEGTHFFPDAHPSDVATKLLAVNLSDMAAMGAMPRWATVALTLPTINPQWLDEFSRALHVEAQAADVEIVGGDTTKGSLCVSMQIMGLVDSGNALCRSAAKQGDDIYVSGFVGDAGLGLGVLSGELKIEDPAIRQRLIAAQTRGNSRVALGLALQGKVNACIDVSDGLIADVGHIAEQSELAIHLQLDKIPLSDDYLAVVDSVLDSLSPDELGPDELSPDQLKGVDHALQQSAQRAIKAASSGEDYELVFTAPQANREPIERLSSQDCPITRIGTVVAQNKTAVEFSYLGDVLEIHEKLGFDHFA